MRTRPRGIIAAAATPIAEDLTVDGSRLIVHLRRLLELGCDGINLLGTTGEATSLPLDARIDTMCDVRNAGLPVERFLVGTGAAALEDAVALTSAAHELGFGGALLLPPFYYKGIDTAGLVAYVAELVRRVGRPDLALYLYHFPALSGIPWTLETLTELKTRFPATIKGLKDSSGDLDYSRQAAQRIEDFDVFPSAEGALTAPDASLFAGCISATANITAPLASAGWHAHEPALRSAKIGAAARLRDAFTSLPLIAAVKETLAGLYSDVTWHRLLPPLRPLSVDESTKLSSALAATEFESVQAIFAKLS